MTTPRRWTLAAIAALVALAAIAAIAACSSSYITRDASAGGTDADADADADESAPDASDDGREGGACIPVPVQPAPPAHGGSACPSDASACFPGDVTSFTPAWVPPIAPHANACTATQIAGAYTACLGGTQTTTACPTWVDANEDCWACLSTSQTGSEYGAGINLGPEYLVNTPGCVALVEPCNQPCAAAFQADVFCANLAACNPMTGPCTVTASSSTAYQNCAAAAGSCGCSGYNASAQCLQLLIDEPDMHPAVATCGLAGAFEARYNAIAAFICGP